MSQWNKLIDGILRLDKNLRFEDLAKALMKMGYTQSQPKGGSSHYTFRKTNCMPITLPKSKNPPIDIVYIRLVREAFIKDLDFERGEPQ